MKTNSRAGKLAGPHLSLDWRQLFQAVPDGLIVIDIDFNVLFVNRAFSALSGLSEAEAVGRKCFDVFPGSLCGGAGCPLTRIQSGVERLLYEGDKRCACGRLIPSIISATPYRDTDGKLIGIVESVADIRALRRAQDELHQSHERLRKAMGGIIQAMSLTIEKRDAYTAGHQRRVAKLCRAIATDLGFSWERIQGLRMAAAIHDVGKIQVPLAILNKPAKLSQHEVAIIRLHPEAAYDILKGIEFPWPIAQTIYQHHERLDGSGYPQGLKADRIIMEARILAVADVVEAMISLRPYRAVLAIDKALEELAVHRGVLYDAGAVDVCTELFTRRGFDFQAKCWMRRRTPT